jgi:hypothetical protein
MLINEVTSKTNEMAKHSKTYAGVNRYLLKHKIQDMLGHGSDAEVYVDPDSHKVVYKVLIGSEPGRSSSSAFSAFTQFYKYVKSHRDNKHLPLMYNPIRIYRGKTPHNETVYMVPMERLDSLGVDNLGEVASAMADTANKYKNNPSQMSAFLKNYMNIHHVPEQYQEKILEEVMGAFDTISDLLRKTNIGKLDQDLSSENVMRRGNTIVITDPYFDAGAGWLNQ